MKIQLLNIFKTLDLYCECYLHNSKTNKKIIRQKFPLYVTEIVYEKKNEIKIFFSLDFFESYSDTFAGSTVLSNLTQTKYWLHFQWNGCDDAALLCFSYYYDRNDAAAW